MKNTDKNVSASAQDVNDRFPGYPQYPPSEDIYAKGHKEADINPEDTSQLKATGPIEAVETRNQKDFRDDVSGSDLDIPGSELDDAMEGTGSEDEENNHYSLGGDNHNDLEEDDE